MKAFHSVNIENAQAIAVKFAKDSHGVIFTQIHGGTGPWNVGNFYAGWFNVNRTGTYLVFNPNDVNLEIKSDTIIRERWDYRDYTLAGDYQI